VWIVAFETIAPIALTRKTAFNTLSNLQMARAGFALQEEEMPCRI